MAQIQIQQHFCQKSFEYLRVITLQNPIIIYTYTNTLNTESKHVRIISEPSELNCARHSIAEKWN